MHRAVLVGVGLAMAVTIAGCSEPLAPVGRLLTVDGQYQIAAVGTALPTRLSVEVKRTDGSPARDVEVEWTTSHGALSAEGEPAPASLTATVMTRTGDGGTILRYDGSAWNPQPSGTTANLYAVKAVSRTLAYAVGNDGTLAKYDGAAWTIEVVYPHIDLRGVWASGPNNVYAVGAPK